MSRYNINLLLKSSQLRTSGYISTAYYNPFEKVVH